jgi:hypothetical protein
MSVGIFFSLDDGGAAQRGVADGSAQTALENARERADALEHRLASLALTCAAMWSLLQERAGITEQELLDRMHALDMRDGKVDGRMNAEALTCGSCKRKSSARHKRCMYCGAALPETTAFGSTPAPPVKPKPPERRAR